MPNATTPTPSRDVIIAELEEVYRGPAWHGPALLGLYHGRLVSTIHQASDAALARQTAPGGQPIARQLLGMAIHDASHAGQIRHLALTAAERNEC